MSNPNNCATCRYSQIQHDGLHCYMFRKAPTEVCMQHTGRKEIIPTPQDILVILEGVKNDR